MSNDNPNVPTARPSLYGAYPQTDERLQRAIDPIMHHARPPVADSPTQEIMAGVRYEIGRCESRAAALRVRLAPVLLPGDKGVPVGLRGGTEPARSPIEDDLASLRERANVLADTLEHMLSLLRV